MTTSTKKTAPTPIGGSGSTDNGLEEIITFFSPLIIVAVAYLALHRPVTQWAYTHHLFSRDAPLFVFPGAAVTGSGPTIICCGLLVEALATLVVAAAAVVTTRNRAPRTGVYLAAVAMVVFTAAAIAGIMVAPTMQWLSLFAAVALSAAATTVCAPGVTRLVSRYGLRMLLEDNCHAYAGYPERPSTGFVSLKQWTSTAHQPTPHPAHVAITYRGRPAEKTATDLAAVITDCVDGPRYTVRLDLKSKSFIAVPETPKPAEPAAVARLRQHVATPQIFESTATVADIMLRRTTNEITGFRVNHNISTKLVDSPRTKLIERRLSELLPGGRFRATTWDHPNSTAVFRLRPEFPRAIFPKLPAEVTTAAEVISGYPDTVLHYADDEDGRPIVWDPEVFPHTLCVGSTGTGKTATTHTVIVDATRQGWPVFIFDFKGKEYTHYRDWPNVAMVITKVEQAIAVIHLLHIVLMKRYTAGELDPSATRNTMPMLIVIDEVAEFMDRINAFYNDHKGKGAPKTCPTVSEFYSFLRLARSARQHFFLGMQRPDIALLGSGEARENVSHFISMGRQSGQAAGMVWGSQHTGRTVPMGVRGRATARDSRGEPVEVQCYWTPDPNLVDDPSIVQVWEDLRPTVALHPRQVVGPIPTGDDLEFSAFQNVPVYLATERPDLDPLSEEYRARIHATDLAGFDISSALLTTAAGGSPLPTAVSAMNSGITSETVDLDTTVWEEEFLEPTDCRLDDLDHGDLILVDDDIDRWALLDGSPDDLGDGTVSLLWRDILTGEEGETIVDAAATVIRRLERPTPAR